MSVDLNVAVLALQIEHGARLVAVSFHRESGDFDLKGPIDAKTDGGTWSARKYVYKCLPEVYATLKVGSLVVVQARSHYQVVRVEDLDAEVDYGDTLLVERLRWILSDISGAVQVVQDIGAQERKTKKKITNSRITSEAREILKNMSLSDDDLSTLAGTMIRRAPALKADDREVVDVQDETHE